jgi:hypothetical protein
MNLRLMVRSIAYSIFYLAAFAGISFQGFCQSSVAKQFERPPEKYLGNYETIIVGEITGENSAYKAILSSEIAKLIAYQLAEHQVITEKDPQWPSLNYRELNQSTDTVFALPKIYGNTLIITGQISENSLQLDLLKEPMESGKSGGNSQKGCTHKFQYVLKGNVKLRLKFIDAGTGILVYQNSVLTRFNNNWDVFPCNPPPKPEETEIIRKILFNNHKRFLEKFIKTHQLVEFDLKDNFWADPFPSLSRIVTALNEGKNEEALKLLGKYASFDFKPKIRGLACYNYAVGLLFDLKFDSALFYAGKSAELLPGEKDTEELALVIRREKEIRDKIIQMGAGLKKNNGSLQENAGDGNSIPDIYAVIVGVADYKDPAVKDLQFTENDCRAFHDFLTSPAGGNVPSSNLRLLTSVQATRAGFIKAMKETFGKATENDLVFLFIACHGETDASGSDVYFLMNDTENENLEGTAVSNTEIRNIINRSKSRKKLIIADACHSGGLGLDAGKRAGGSSQMVHRLLFQMGQSDNFFAILSASSNYESSEETRKLGNGHGVFTYFLLEGLKGKADANGNGLVTIREIQDYTYKQVSEFTMGKQHPELKGFFSNSFPISVTENRKN